jgi:hypothetical protein
MFGMQPEKQFVNRRKYSPVRSEFSTPKSLRRLITVCAWCKGIQNAEGFWRHAENAPQPDSGSKVSHGICPECAERSYHEFRLANSRQTGPLLRNARFQKASA